MGLIYQDSNLSDVILGTYCLLCGEIIPLSEDDKIRVDRGHSIEQKICPTCKKIWTKFKEQYNEQD